MGYLTTHVLDTAHGLPGKGISVDLYRIEGTNKTLLHCCITNDDGRTDTPVLAEAEFAVGEYELVFSVASYFRKIGVVLPDPAFIDEVVIRFGIADIETHYHVPLLVSPYGYSTYRGS